MAKVFDILTDEAGELQVKAGDFVVGESTEQHQGHLLIAEKGQLIDEETSGVALRTFLLDEVDGNELKSTIQAEFEADGMKINTLKIDSMEEANINAEYKDEDN